MFCSVLHIFFLYLSAYSFLSSPTCSIEVNVEHFLFIFSDTILKQTLPSVCVHKMNINPLVEFSSFYFYRKIQVLQSLLETI